MKEIGEQFHQFHSEKFFCISFGKYIKTGCMGNSSKRQVERLVSEVISSGTDRNLRTLKVVRASAKQFIKSDKRQRELFNASAKYFLHGRLPMKFDDFKRFIKNEK